MADKRYVINMSEGAAGDLDAIHAYAADQRSLDDADILLDALYGRVETLEQFALRGGLVPETAKTANLALRQILHLPYRLIYRVVDDTVTIIAIVDGRRDVQTFLRQRLLTSEQM